MRIVFPFARAKENFVRLARKAGTRNGLLASAGLILLAGGIYSLSYSYRLSPAAAGLAGTSSSHPLKGLKYDAKAQAHKLTGHAPDANAVQIGVDSYTAFLPKDASKGVSITDPATKLSLGFVPKFTVGSGKLVDGRMLYPLPNYRNGSLVYTLKNNGIEENIILTKKALQDSQHFSYKLRLDKGLEARLLPNGSLGVYGADPILYGNISYGSEADRTKLERARQQAKKNILIYVIPTPVIKGGGNAVKASFKLADNTLTVQVKGLRKATYPLAIDPSLVLVSANDWTNGTDEDNNIDFSVPGQITRAGLKGGTLGSWSNTGTGLTSRFSAGVAAYNGFVYVTGGCVTQVVNCTAITASVQKAPLSSSGIGTWTTEASLPEATWEHNLVAYNGYLYTQGGSLDTASHGTTNNWYININSDGTLGSSWSSFTGATGVIYTASVAANSYIYTSGGANTGVGQTTVRYQHIRGDGTPGTIQTTTPLATGVWLASMSYYNGYLYVTGGCTTNPCNTNYITQVQSAKVNSDGTVGAWSILNSFTTARALHTSWANNGYLYIAGGQTNAMFSDVQYAPIYADGTIGTWSATTSLGTARTASGGVSFGGYLYNIGGSNGSIAISTSEYAKIDSEGVAGPPSSQTLIGTGRNAFATAYGDGYIYVLSGCTGGCTNISTMTLTATVEYAPVGTDGTLGSWTQTSQSLPQGIVYGSAAFHNGYLYMLGGGFVLGCPVSCTYQVLSTVYRAPVSQGNTTGAFSATGQTTLPQALYGASAAVYNDHIYLAGGANCSGIVGVCSPTSSNTSYATVYRADFDTSDNLSAWTQLNSFSLARTFTQAKVYNGYLYVIGGYTGVLKDDIQRALLSNDGLTIGTFTTDSVHLPYATVFHGVVFKKGYMYLAGGEASGGDQSSLYYAKIGTSGAVSGSFTATKSMLTAHSLGGIAVFAEGIYVLGGCITSNTSGCSSAALRTVELLKIHSGGPGSPGSWSSASTTPLPSARSASTATVYGGNIYMVGGLGASGGIADVIYAPISDSGAVGSWLTATSLPSTRYGHAMETYNGYLYVIEGTTSDASRVRYAKFSSGGGLDSDAGCGSTWCASTATAFARSEFASAAYNGYLYIMGGYNGINPSNSVQYSKFNPTGGLMADAGCGSVWCTANSFTLPRVRFAAVAVNGYIYVVGGWQEATPKVINDVQFAAINSNGSLGSWAYTSALPRATRTHTVVAANGYMYAIGGQHSQTPGGDGTSLTGVTGDVYEATINSNGMLGTWTLQSTTMSIRGGHSSVIYNGRVYSLGGQNMAGVSPTYYNTVESAGLHSSPRIAHYTKRFSTDKDTTPVNFLARFTNAIGNYFGVSYTIATAASPAFGSSTASTPTTDTKTSLNSTQAAYYDLTFTLDDSIQSTFPDNNGLPTTLTYFQLNYHPNSTMRLRGGKTFNSGELQSLDAP